MTDQRRGSSAGARRHGQRVPAQGVGGNACDQDNFIGLTRDSSACAHGTGNVSGMAILIASTISAALGVSLLVLGNTDVPYQEAAGQNQGRGSGDLHDPKRTGRGQGRRAGRWTRPMTTPRLARLRSTLALALLRRWER